MERAGDALRQALMSSEEYERLPPDKKVWDGLARPVLVWSALVLGLIVAIAGVLITVLTFDMEDRLHLCSRDRLPRVPSTFHVTRDAYRLTDYEAAAYLRLVFFIPVAVLFMASLPYLLAGIMVAYSAPRRHFMLNLVDNSCCGSRKGGVWCLKVIYVFFMVAFGLLWLFHSSSIIFTGTGCSQALYWCYLVMFLGMEFLFLITAHVLSRKAAVILDPGEHYGSRTPGIELRGYEDEDDEQGNEYFTLV